MKQFTLIMAGLAMAASAHAGAVRWETDYDKAVAAAKKDNKLVMVDIYADWCGPCRMMDRKVFSNADVQAKLAEKFIAVRIDTERNRQSQRLMRQFDTRGIPHVVFVNGQGKKVDQIVGYVPANEFVKRLDKVVSTK